MGTLWVNPLENHGENLVGESCWEPLCEPFWELCENHVGNTSGNLKATLSGHTVVNPGGNLCASCGTMVNPVGNIVGNPEGEPWGDPCWEP